MPIAIINRRKFIIKLARALMTFSAPSHRIEMQLSSAARVLELEAEFVHLPSIVRMMRLSSAWRVLYHTP